MAVRFTSPLSPTLFLKSLVAVQVFDLDAYGIRSRLRIVKDTRIGTLKSISGRLRRMLAGHHELRTESIVPRLLIVDDEESICFSMSEYFEHHGYKVDTARDMDEAEKLIEATTYRVIIQDLRLGINRNNDGLENIKMVD